MAPSTERRHNSRGIFTFCVVVVALPCVFTVLGLGGGCGGGGVGVVLLAGGYGARGRGVGPPVAAKLPADHLLQNNPRCFLGHIQRFEEELPADL